MNISVQKQPQCQATLEVEIPSGVVSEERQQLLQSFVSQANIPGFRPGKAPRKVVEKRFGKSINEELNGRLMDKAFQQTLKEDESLKVIDVKWPESLDFREDGSALLKANLILAPDFTLPNYKELTVEVPKMEVTDELVDKELDTLRDRHSDFEDVEDRAVADEDIIVIDYTSTCDGKPVSEVAERPVDQVEKGEDFWLKVDEESFLPGFATQLIDMKIGESKEVTVTIEENFPLETLREKDLVFQVTIKGIKEQKLPSDEELVEALMPNGSIEDIREAIESQLKMQLDRQREEFKESKLLEQIADAVDFDLPEEYVASETQGQANRLVQDAMQRGMSQEQIQADEKEILETAGQRARNNLKVQFLLGEIAQEEKLAVDEKELLGAITSMAKREGKPLKAFIKQLQRERRIDSLRNQMLIGKTVDFLLESANFVEVENSDNDSESESDD
ncbi:trigger factor [Roseibacillus ishigakijimensis]|uniref:Trigger factor n=1 Tax=Roseibacillus ishigakijimensis TaxID=454146 RepID=A0A934VNR8_9BACT|nr:trigger factor [Roseibacillus ishigakijimensis]MBK1835351.1 trigger factor [Roseibacillus ishigakijimensis]